MIRYSHILCIAVWVRMVCSLRVQCLLLKFTHITSCTPKNNKYNIIIGQLIRYAKACDHYKDFIQAATADISILLTKCELLESSMKHQIRKFAIHHQQYYVKYLIQPHQLIKDLTNTNNPHNKNNMRQP